MSDAEKFGRDLILSVFGRSTKSATKFSYRDISEIRDRAVARFVGYPSRCRIEGMVVDLTDDEKRALAFFEASVEVMNRLGVIDVAKLDHVMPRPFTEVQEVVQDQLYGLTFTPQKK